MIKLLLIFTLLIINVNAATLFPMVDHIYNKKTSKKLFTVANPTDEPVAVEFYIKRLVDTNNNKEVLKETKEFKYFPSKFVLKPHAKRKVRVTYKGDFPKIEKVYRVIAHELDVDLSKKGKEVKKIKANVKMRYTFRGILTVGEQYGSPEFQVISTKKIKNGIKVTVKNNGNKSEVINPKKYSVIVKTTNGEKHILSNKEFNKIQFRRILPGKTNTYIINFPSANGVEIMDKVTK